MDSKDISIIVQGPINITETPKTLQSIRKFFPNAEIIVSTWKNSQVANLDYDILVLNEDPGAELLERNKNKKIYNNINRQLLSTQHGLEKATRKYAMKLRSDLIFTHDIFLKYFNMFPKRVTQYSLFEHKVLIPALFTRFSIPLNSRNSKVKIPFHISDWWLFGLKEDLIKYFCGTPLVEEPYFTYYFEYDENKGKLSPYGAMKYKFSPEQYFGYQFFSRNCKNIYMKDASDYSDELMEEFRKYFINNFIVLEFKHSGIYLNKYIYSKNEMFLGEQYLGLYNFYRYENEYKKYCDENYKVSSSNIKIFKNELYGYAFLRIYKHIANLFSPRKSFISKIEQILIGIPNSVLLFVLVYLKENLLKKIFK